MVGVGNQSQANLAANPGGGVGNGAPVPLGTASRVAERAQTTFAGVSAVA